LEEEEEEENTNNKKHEVEKKILFSLLHAIAVKLVDAVTVHPCRRIVFSKPYVVLELCS